MATYRLARICLVGGWYEESLKAARRELQLRIKNDWDEPRGVDHRRGVMIACETIVESLVQLQRWSEVRQCLIDYAPVSLSILCDVRDRRRTLPDYRIWCVSEWAEEYIRCMEQLVDAERRLGDHAAAAVHRSQAGQLRHDVMAWIEDHPYPQSENTQLVLDRSWWHLQRAETQVATGDRSAAIEELNRARNLLEHPPAGVQPAELYKTRKKVLERIESLTANQNQAA